MRPNIHLLSLFLATVALAAPHSAASGCVYTRPLPEEVHIIIRKQNASSLKRWLVWEYEMLDAIDPESGRTPLMTALIAERPKHFRVLLAAGAKLDLTDGAGNSALHVAAQINEPWHVLALLKAGADPSLRNAQGQTFQRYLYMTPEKLLNAKTRKGIEEVKKWLTLNGLEVETPSAR